MKRREALKILAAAPVFATTAGTGSTSAFRMPAGAAILSTELAPKLVIHG